MSIILDPCDNLGISISPNSLQNLINPHSYNELVGCLEKFSSNYAISREEVDIELIKFCRSIVRPAVESEALGERYIGKLVLYRKLANYKITFGLRMLAQFEYVIERLKQTPDQIEIGSEALLITRNGLLCSCLSQLFFSIEHSSKIACSLTDDKFAKKVAKGIPVSHGEVFGVLKRLSTRGYLMDFNALAKIYAYVIKSRMIADYTEFFYGEFDIGPLLSLLIQVANDIFNSQKDLLFQCLGV